MLVTIATHNGGGQANREHNIRNPRVTKQGDGPVEIWKDIKVRDAYRMLFQSAVDAYNSKQTRADRKIDNYYNQIKHDAKKHDAYEMVVGVYMQDETQINYKLQRKILIEFTADWYKRNPNLALIGAYLHADEKGQAHVHLDYIPVAHGYTRGPEKQTGLVRALGEMGFYKKGKDTAQIQWEARENAALEKLCARRGLKVVHPQIEGRKHLDTEIYQQQQELVKLQDKIQQGLQTYRKLLVDIEREQPLATVRNTVTISKGNLLRLERALEALADLEEPLASLSGIKADYRAVKREVDYQQRKLDQLKDMISEQNFDLQEWLRQSYPEILEEFLETELELEPEPEEELKLDLDLDWDLF